jgi:hypothetical protein
VPSRSLCAHTSCARCRSSYLVSKQPRQTSSTANHRCTTFRATHRSGDMYVRSSREPDRTATVDLAMDVVSNLRRAAVSQRASGGERARTALHDTTGGRSRRGTVWPAARRCRAADCRQQPQPAPCPRRQDVDEDEDEPLPHCKATAALQPPARTFLWSPGTCRHAPASAPPGPTRRPLRRISHRVMLCT